MASPLTDESCCYYIPCRLSRDIVNTEIYLFNCLNEYKKHVFWELPHFLPNHKVIHLDRKCEILSIPPIILKDYWKKIAWFKTEINETDFKNDVKEEAVKKTEPQETKCGVRKMEDKMWLTYKLMKLEEILGETESEGLARASNKACDVIFKKILDKQNVLSENGIHLFC